MLSLLLILNTFYFFFWCFDYWFWACKCLLITVCYMCANLCRINKQIGCSNSTNFVMDIGHDTCKTNVLRKPSSCDTLALRAKFFLWVILSLYIIIENARLFLKLSKFLADLVTYTEEISNGKLHFLHSDNISNDWYFK